MNAAKLHQIIGDDKYNQLVDSLDDTIRKGRFRFWQDNLFSEISDKTGGKISFEQFVEIMSNAKHAIRDVSADEFLADPISVWRDQTARFDSTLIQDAWENSPEFAAAVCDECLCSIALTDSLQDLSRDASLLAKNLSPEICAQIYRHVARWVCMPESEWRQNFLSVFPEIAPAVPGESKQDGVSLVARLRSELLKEVKHEGAELQKWLIAPRLVTAGARECWLLLETSNSCGLLYAPYGSLEPEYKWGIANQVEFATAEDQTWVTSFAEAVDVLIEDSQASE